MKEKKFEPQTAPNPEQERKEQKKKRRKRKRRALRFIIILLILIGLVLGILIGGKLGLGERLGLSPRQSSQSETEDGKQSGQSESEPTASVSATSVPTQSPENREVLDAYITVNEYKLFLNNTELSIGGLKAQLENAYKGSRVTLIDDYAIKSSYEEVQTLLESLGITEYEEKKAEQ